MSRRAKVTIALCLALIVLPTVCSRGPKVTPPPPPAAEEPVQVEPTTTPAVPTSAPSPVLTTTTGPSAALEVTEPITAKLPHATPAYVIDFHLDGSQVTLTITLRAVLNRPSQRPQYLLDITAAKAAALSWLADQGYTGDLPVTWVPPLAATL